MAEREVWSQNKHMLQKSILDAGPNHSLHMTTRAQPHNTFVKRWTMNKSIALMAAFVSCVMKPCCVEISCDDDIVL